MFSDSHCHLDEFSDIKKQVEKAVNAGVGNIVSNSVDLKSMQKNLEISEKFKTVHCTFGIHPSNSLRMKKSEINACFSFIEKNYSKSIAVGETGLDFKHAQTPEQKEFQKTLFCRHISIAKKTRLPIIVHSRMARKECVDMLIEAKAKKVLLHWFSGKGKSLENALNAGYFVSIGPSALFQPHSQEFAEKIPLKNLLIETDAPVHYNGKKAEPCWAAKVAEKIAELKGIEKRALEKEVGKNFRKLFG